MMQVREVGRTSPRTIEITCNSTQYNTVVHGLLRLEADKAPRTAIYVHHMLEEMQVSFRQEVRENGCICALHQNKCPFGVQHHV